MSFKDATPPETELTDQVKAALRDGATAISLRASGPVRGAFLRWLLLELLPTAKSPLSRFELSGATIEGDLDLRAATLKIIVRCADCRFDSTVVLDDATIVGWEMIGGSASQINADRVTASGSMLFCADATSGSAGPRASQIRLCGAKIRGNLDLRGADLRGKLEVNDLVALLADGASVDGNLLLGNGFKASGEARLNGSKIARNLDCSGAELSCPSGYSLSAAGARISGSAYLAHSGKRAFTSEGTVRFEGAKIDGNFDCIGGIFTAARFCLHADADASLFAIKADGIDIASNLLLRSNEDGGRKFEAHGIVSLDNAKVGGDFKCNDAMLDFPGEEPLRADGITVAGGISLHGLTTNGILSFLKASFKQGFYASGLTFDRAAGYRNWLDRLRPSIDELAEPDRGVCGIYAPSAEVGGIFFWKEIEKVPQDDPPVMNPLWLFLPSCKASTVEDDEESWTALDRFDITGCDYDRVFDLSSDTGWRLAVLDCQYAPLNHVGWVGARALLRGMGTWVWWLVTRLVMRWRLLRGASRRSGDIGISQAVKRFKPQPYVHFARVLRAAGYEAAANDVLVQLQRNKTRYSDLGAFSQLWRWILDFVLLYGFSPFRPLVIVIVWAVVSAFCFERAYYDKRIVPAKGQQTIGAYLTPPFNPLIFAVDTLVPIVDLNQKKNWIVTPVSETTGLVHQRPDPTKWWLDPWGALGRMWTNLPGFDAGGLIVFNTFFGWAMTTFFAAGVSGLLRSGREGG